MSPGRPLVFALAVVLASSCAPSGSPTSGDVTRDDAITVTAFDFPAGLHASQALEADLAFSFVLRADVVAAVAEVDGATLCGAVAPPCEGGGWPTRT